MRLNAGSDDLRVAFLDGVFQSEVDRIDSALLRKFVDYRLGGEGRVGCTRRAIGRGLGPINDDVVGVDLKILDGVRCDDAHRARADRRAGESARLVGHPDFRGDEFAVLGRAHLHFDLRAGGRTARAQHFRARHDELDRRASLLRQQHRERFEVDGGFATEAATDFGRDHFDVSDRHPEHLRAQRAHIESALGRAIDRRLSVGVVDADGVVRLDVTLVNHRGIEFALDDEVRRLESSFDLAALELVVLRDVGLLVALFLVAQVLQQNRRARLGRGVHRHHGRQHFVLDFDQPQRFLGDMRAGRGDGSDRMAVVQDLFVREDVHRQVHRIDHHLTGLLELVRRLRQILRGDNRLDARQRERLVEFDRFDIRVRMRTAQHLAVQHARERVVGAVLGAARHLVNAVVPNRTCADNFEIASRGRCRHKSNLVRVAGSSSDFIKLMVRI